MNTLGTKKLELTDWLGNIYNVNIVGSVRREELPYLPKEDGSILFILEHNYLNNQDGGCYNIGANENLRYFGIFRQWGGSNHSNPKDFLTTNRFLIVN